MKKHDPNMQYLGGMWVKKKKGAGTMTNATPTNASMGGTKRKIMPSMGIDKGGGKSGKTNKWNKKDKQIGWGGVYQGLWGALESPSLCASNEFLRLEMASRSDILLWLSVAF